MRVTILASGSGGNSCLVESGATRVLVDAGLSARELERRLLARQIDPETIQALFLTHEHGETKASHRLSPCAVSASVPPWRTQPSHVTEEL